MYYSGSADWEQLKELKTEVMKTDPNVVVFGSGDILSPDAAKAMLEETGVDGVMFARGAIGNPFIFNDTIDLLSNKPPKERSLETRLKVMLQQLHYMGEYSGESLACREMRKHASSYLKGLAHGAKAKQALVQSTTYQEYEKVSEDLINGTLTSFS